MKPLAASLWKSIKDILALLTPCTVPCSRMTLYGNPSCIGGLVIVEECAVKPIKSTQKNAKICQPWQFILSHSDNSDLIPSDEYLPWIVFRGKHGTLAMLYVSCFLSSVWVNWNNRFLYNMMID